MCHMRESTMDIINRKKNNTNEIISVVPSLMLLCPLTSFVPTTSWVRDRATVASLNAAILSLLVHLRAAYVTLSHSSSSSVRDDSTHCTPFIEQCISCSHR